MFEHTCSCGCKDTVHKHSIYENIDGKQYEVEYDLYCKECGEYLGHFCYGTWEY